MKVTVVLPGRFESPQVWNLEVSPKPKEEVAEEVFELSNAPEEFLTEEGRALLEKFPRTNIRSVSVGDMIIIEDEHNPIIRHIAIVEGMGFKFV